MKVYLYGMKNKARDERNYLKIDYIRDLYLEEMTCDLTDKYYNVLCYSKKLEEFKEEMYGYEYIGTKDIDDE